MKELINSLTDILFYDVGRKIKNAAVATALLGMVCSIIGGVIAIIAGLADFKYCSYLILMGPIGAISGCIATWLCCLPIYGFGQLIENTEPKKELRAATETAPVSVSPTNLPPLVTKKHTPAPTAPHSWRCSTCGRMIDQNPCPFCADVADKEIKQDDFNWVCPRCGKKNLKERPNCWSCGFKK